MFEDRVLDGWLFKVQVVVVVKFGWYFGLVDDNNTRDFWQRPRMSGKVVEQGLCAKEHSGIAGINGSAHVHTKNAAVQYVIDSLGRDVALLKKSKSVADMVL